MRQTDLVVSERIRVPQAEFQFTFVRSSGPGGQNVNKVSSKAVMRWSFHETQALPPDVRVRFRAKFTSQLTTEGDLVISSQRYRDQGRNIDDCLEKLRVMLLQVARAPIKRRPTKPTRGSQERRLQKKAGASRKKESRRFSADD